MLIYKLKSSEMYIHVLLIKRFLGSSFQKQIYFLFIPTRKFFDKGLVLQKINNAVIREIYPSFVKRRNKKCTLYNFKIISLGEIVSRKKTKGIKYILNYSTNYL